MSKLLAIAAVTCLGSAVHAGIMIEVRQVDNSHVFGPGVWHTFDIVATVDSGSDLTTIESFAVTDGVFYEHPLGTDVPQPNLWGLLPELEFDSFYAIPPDFSAQVHFVYPPLSDPYYRQALWLKLGHVGEGEYVVARYTISYGSGLVVSGHYSDAAHGGELFTFQPSFWCLMVAHPDAQAVPAVGGDFSFDVATIPVCNWTVSTDTDWVTIDPGWTGMGREEVFYTVAPNHSPTPRVATIYVDEDYQRATHVIEQAAALPGDLNGDGCVDQEDLGTLLASYGIDGGGDVDGDGMTGQADLGILLGNWGEGC